MSQSERDAKAVEWQRDAARWALASRRERSREEDGAAAWAQECARDAYAMARIMAGVE